MDKKIWVSGRLYKTEQKTATNRKIVLKYVIKFGLIFCKSNEI